MIGPGAHPQSTFAPPLPLPPRAGPVVDADRPVVEPLELWAGLPEAHHPVRSTDSGGTEHVMVGTSEIHTRPPGSPTSGLEGDPRTWLAAMDADDVDQAVLYPTLGLSFSAVEDPEAAVGLAVTYNDWLAGGCDADPDRLFGMAMLPLQDPTASAHELRRAVTDHGFVGGFVPPGPCLGRSLSDRVYDPVWDVAEELAVPIGVHASDPGATGAVSHSFESMLACAQLIASGVLERHPGLRVVFVGSSGGWVPFCLDRLDASARDVEGPSAGPSAASARERMLRPSEYFARQCAVSFDVDECTLPALAPLIGTEHIVWGSSRHDAEHAPPVDTLRATVAPCPTAVQAKVLGVTARGVHRLGPRRAAPAGVVDDYFAAVTAQDPAMLRGLFSDEATLDVDGDCRTGPEAIVSYYTERTFTFEDFRPAPGPLQSAGSRITVDIAVHLGGTDASVRDVFEVEAGRIAALQVRGFASALRSIPAGRGEPHLPLDPQSQL